MKIAVNLVDCPPIEAFEKEFKIYEPSLHAQLVPLVVVSHSSGGECHKANICYSTFAFPTIFSSSEYNSLALDVV